MFVLEFYIDVYIYSLPMRKGWRERKKGGRVKNQAKEIQCLHFPNASNSSCLLDKYFIVHYSSSEAIPFMYMLEEQSEEVYHFS